MRAMRKNALGFMLFFTGLILLFVLLMQPLAIVQYYHYIEILFPKGSIGVEQRNLLLIIQALMLLVIIPVYILTFYFSWKYRATNQKATYDPDLVDNLYAEIIWWGLPLIMTFIVGAITIIKTYELDPYKPLVSDKKAKTIQVVALQWKWLFIYPEEKIASLNFLQIPKDTPIHFEITADAPMNSFWIPALGGQIYAMPKMKTELHLIANEAGDFRGSSANISGEGFAGMFFTTRASSDEDYKKWVEEASKSSKQLDFTAYRALAAPSSYVQPEIFQLKDDNLFNNIMMQYMRPQQPTAQGK